MKLTVQHPNYGEVNYNSSLFGKKKQITVNGTQLEPAENNTFVFKDKANPNADPKTFTLKHGIAGKIALVIEKDEIVLRAYSKLFEYILPLLSAIFMILWCKIPFFTENVFPMADGVIGGVIAGAMVASSVLLMQRTANFKKKVFIWLGVFLTALVASCLAANIISWF